MTNLKLFDYVKYSDYGSEWYFQLFSAYPKFALIDLGIQWDDFPATEIFPLFLVSIGSRSLCGFSFRWKWFAINCGIIDFNPRNLEYYRRTYDE